MDFFRSNPFSINVFNQSFPTEPYSGNFMDENMAKMAKNGQNGQKKGYPAYFEAHYLKK